MPHTYLVFVWHMHQPFYKDLATGEYQLPWTRLHALKDYYGMVRILEDFPEIHQTFNLVPSMLTQIDEYASGEARDPFLRLALKPAEELTGAEREFILKYFFQVNPRVVHRFPRFAELHDAWRAAHGQTDLLGRTLDAKCLRDLQVLSQLAWFDEIFLESDPDIGALIEKGRDFSLEDQALVGAKEQQICGMVAPEYARAAARGQIELSFTPYYHPILPLLCDSNIASIAHPNVPLPRPFRYPQDAQHQIRTALEFAETRFGARPRGLWPSEGSVSDEVLSIAADLGIEWMATDNGVLGATLSTLAGVNETYRPYIWKQNGRQMRMIFRDHFLSDLIGFVYSRMDARAAAHHFLDRIQSNAQGRDTLVPIILDGENAWEYYDRGGRPFLKELYKLISDTPGMSAVTVSEALARVPAEELTRIHPGSWINANFDIWIGAEEDNRAWEFLLDARETYERMKDSPALTDAQKQLAFEELMIAEGSDWCWWYGPEHHSDNREEFDKLFRDHVAHVYRALALTPPEALARPIARISAPAFHQKPCGFISPTIDGLVTSYFEWLGAGIYAPDRRQGAMHGRASAINEVRYASDGERFYLRVDLLADSGATEIRVVRNDGAGELRFSLADPPTADCAYFEVFELALPFGASSKLGVQVSVWREGLPLDAAPAEGWLEISASDPAEWD